MDNQNQNQAPQPNFDFIMNQPQPGSPPSAPDGHKKMSKKMIILAVMVVLTLVMLAIVIFVPTPTEQNADENPGSTQQTNVADTFFKNMVERKTYAENKANMTTTLLAVIPDEKMYNFTTARITDSIDIPTCQKLETIDNVQTYDCKKKVTGEVQKLKLTMAKDTDGVQKVNAFSVEANQ